MFEEFDTTLQSDKGAKIKIVGVGGGGSNAVNKMLEDKIEGIEFIVANTDKQALLDSKVRNKILLGDKLTKGLGAGALPEVGRKAAEESIEDIQSHLKGSDLVFVAAGLGGGTGTGAAPVIAKAAKETGAVVIAIITTPFSFEGNKRRDNSVQGLKLLAENVDSFIVISNERLLDELGEISITESFKYSDAILKQAVRTIADIINDHSVINLDFADVKTIIANQGAALIGVGRAAGENASVEAAINAINSPILESSIEGARNAIVSIAGSSKSLTIVKAKEAVETIKEAASPQLEIIFGVTINEDLGDEIIVSVIATGLDQVKSSNPSSSNSSDSTSEIKAMAAETDIERYKEMGQTKEFDASSFNFDEAKPMSSSKKDSSDDIFNGFSILDDEESDDTLEAFLGE